MRSLVVIFVALSLSAIPLFSQVSLDFNTLRTSGPVPSVQKEITSTETQISGFSMDPIGLRLHWVNDNEWYRLDLRTGHWTLHPIQSKLDLFFPRWGVIPGSLELRAWDDGVGRVIRIDSNGIPTRIDQSFNQKTQFGHVSHLEKDGTIHAIGGLGLYHPKNYGITFSEVSAGWHRTSGDERVVNDPFLSSGYALKDPGTSALILFTTFGMSDWPYTPGILVMDMSSGSIRVLHSDVPILLNLQFRNGRIWQQSSVFDGSHRIAFIRASTQSDNPLISRLIALDLDTYRIVEIEGLNESNTDPGPLHTVLHYNEPDSTLYSVQWTHHTIDMVNFVSVSTAKVDVRSLRAMLAKGKNPVEPKSDLSSHPVWPWQAAFLVALIGFFVVLRQARSAGSKPMDHSRKLNVRPDPLELNGRPWEDLLEGNYPLEAQLLALLAKAAQNGNPIVSSDTIDRMLIPNHPSPDFIRKTRNQTRKRLEDSLQSLWPSPNNQPYIISERDVLDKRKTKLQLNLAVVELTPTE
jgi:hypothetical protein